VAALHPKATALFTFDQSTNNEDVTEDALRATNMKMNSGGKQAILRNGWYGTERTPQKMFVPTNHVCKMLQGQAIRLKVVFLER
jgi:hypothetical protein